VLPAAVARKCAVGIQYLTLDRDRAAQIIQVV